MEEDQPTTQPDDAYELLDSGGGRVLERLGTVTGVRSHPQAWWRRRLGGAEWKKGLDLKRDLQQPLKVRFGALTLLVGGAGGSLRALGPELAESWQQATAACMAFATKHRRPARVLHLFGGAGGHTLAASLGGAAVAHVDASGESLARARENAAAQPQAGRDIRWVLDDPVKFAQRERTQSQRHDLIILNPPTAPRDGKRGFDLERDLPPLLGTVSALLSDTACGVMLVCRQPGVSPTALLHLMRHDLSIFGGRFEHGELLLGGAAHPSAVPCGAFCHWWKA